MKRDEKQSMEMPLNSTSLNYNDNLSKNSNEILISNNMPSKDQTSPVKDNHSDEFYLQDDSPNYRTPSRKPWEKTSRVPPRSQVNPSTMNVNDSNQIYPKQDNSMTSQPRPPNSSRPAQHRVRPKRHTSSHSQYPDSHYNNNLTSPRRSKTVAGHSPSHHSNISSNAEAASAMMAQEMNAIKALKRLSIGALPTLDPDLPNYSADLYRHPSDPTSNSASLLQNALAIPSASDGLDFSSQPRSYSDGLTSSSPSNSDSDNISFDSTEIDASHASQLLWVPANVHPELAPQEWKTFVQNKVAEIKAEYSDHSKSNENSNADGNSSRIHRRNSRLSRQIRDQESYTDGADILEKRKSRDALNEQFTDPTIKSLSNQIKSLGELENLANDPLQLARSLSMNTGLYSYYSEPSPSLGKRSDSLSSDSSVSQISNDSDSPILPAPTSSLRRSTNTRYHKASIRRGRKDVAHPSPSLKKTLSNKTPSIKTSPSDTSIASETSSVPITSDSSPTTPTAPETPSSWISVSSGLPRKIRIPIAGKTLDEFPFTGDDPLASNSNTKVLLGNDYDNVPKIIPSYSDKSTDSPQALHQSTPNDSPQPIEAVPPKQVIEKNIPKSQPLKEQTEIIPETKKEGDKSSQDTNFLFTETTDTTQNISSIPNHSQSSITSPTSDDTTNQGQNILEKPPSSPTTSGPVEDDDSSTKGKSRKGTWGWLFSGSNVSQSSGADTAVHDATPTEPKISERDVSKVTQQTSLDQPATSNAVQLNAHKSGRNNSTASLQQPTKSANSTPISKDRISNFFSKKKSSASLKQQKFAEKQIENTQPQEPKPAEATDTKASSKYLSVDNGSNKKSRSPSPKNRRSRSKSPNFRAGKSEGKSKGQNKQRSRYRSRTRSPDKRPSNDKNEKDDSENTSITSGQSITAKPMPEGSIVAYSPEAAAYYGAPYQIPPHQMSDKSLIMMHHRYPLHIERAIYRLSHIKLANAKRPLVQQVLLSNFMYAYLNLINQGFIQQQQQAQMQMQMQLQQQQQQQIYQNQYSYENQQNSVQVVQTEGDNYDPNSARYDNSNNEGGVGDYDNTYQLDGQAISTGGEEAYNGDNYRNNSEEEEAFYDTQENVS